MLKIPKRHPCARSDAPGKKGGGGNQKRGRGWSGKGEKEMTESGSRVRSRRRNRLLAFVGSVLVVWRGSDRAKSDKEGKKENNSWVAQILNYRQTRLRQKHNRLTVTRGGRGEWKKRRGVPTNKFRI